MEHTLPFIGRITLEPMDYLNLGMSLVLIGLGVREILAVDTVLLLVVFNVGLGLCLSAVTVYLGKVGVRIDEMVNPINQYEAFRNVALIEGAARHNPDEE